MKFVTLLTIALLITSAIEELCWQSITARETLIGICLTITCADGREELRTERHTFAEEYKQLWGMTVMDTQCDTQCDTLYLLMQWRSPLWQTQSRSSISIRVECLITLFAFITQSPQTFSLHSSLQSNSRPFGSHSQFNWQLSPKGIRTLELYDTTNDEIWPEMVTISGKTHSLLITVVKHSQFSKVKWHTTQTKIAKQKSKL